MGRNEDEIASPAQGRFFAFSFPEILRIVREYDFQHSIYRKRIDILFCNLKTSRLDQMPVARFYPQDALYLYSFPKTFSPTRARLIVKTALREFAKLDKSITLPKRDWGCQIDNRAFNAHLNRLNQLSIVEHHWRANYEKRYRGDDKLSSAHILKYQSYVKKKLYTLHITASDNE